MTTQSTGSLKARIAGVLIVLIALPILALAPAFLADRYAAQSPNPDSQVSIQPSPPGVSDERIQNSATTANETPIQSEEGFTVTIESDEDFSGEVLILDALSEDDCVFTLRFADSSNGESDTFTGYIRINDDGVRSDDRNCGISFIDDWKAQ